jgi:oxygen-independent coproporphyrinogen-3 oxidase
VNRVQPYAQVAALVDEARRLDFSSINFDLIYGLPEQDSHTFLRTLELVNGLAPERLAIYNYAHLPDTITHQRRIAEESLPSQDEKALLIRMARRQLGKCGYQPIGLDHFAKPDDELAIAFREGTMRRNFMGYSTQAGTDQLAFGVSAISEYHRSFWQNEKKLSRYYRSVEEGRLPVVRGIYLNDEDMLRKKIISLLFCQGRLDYGEIARGTGVSFHGLMARELEELRPMQADGLVELQDSGLRVTSRGQLFLRNIAMVFDSYLRREGEHPKFSRAV